MTFIIVLTMTKTNHNLPPGPTSVPLLGNILSFINASFQESIEKWYKVYGSIFTISIGSTRMVFLNDIDVLNEAFVKRGAAASGRPFLHSFDIATMGSADILMVSYGDLWKFQRKLATQSIRQYLSGNQIDQRVHEALTPVISDILDKQEQPFNPKEHISLSVMNVLNGICFGSVMDIKDKDFLRMLHTFDRLNQISGSGFLEDFIPPLRKMPTKNFKEFLGLFDWFNKFITRKIDQHKVEFDPNDIRDLTDNMILAKQQADEDPDSPISKQFTDVHAIQTLGDVFAGGVDTSRTQLGWILLVVAARQDIQKKLHEEIDDVVGDKIPGKEHRSKLVYLEAVVLETVRMYPVAPLGVPHETMEDMSVAGYVIPKKTLTVSNQMAILHDPAHWTDPYEFKPERFLCESDTKLAPRNQSFIAFSLGHRVCLGESMAKLQMILTLAGLLQKLTFHLPSGVTADLSNNVNGFLNTPRHYEIVAKSR